MQQGSHPSYLKTLLFFFLLFLSFSAYASGKAPKWGKVTEEEVAIKKVDYDPEAHAVVLAETGNLSYFYPHFHVNIHRRLKILDQEGISEGDIVLSYYSKDKMEKIDNVKAQTIEILPNGKVVKHKVDRNQVFDVSIDDHWNEVRFALPAVKPGSIIEYSYTLTTSNFTFLEGWVFQNHIPTLYSTYKVEIPHYFTYNTLMQGRRIYEKYHNLRATNYWELENLPALKPEPYTYNLMDYAEKIQFQLHSYQVSDPQLGVSEKEVFVDWQAIARDVLNRKEIWSYSHSSRIVEDMLLMVPESQDQVQFAKNIYSFVRNSFSWNGYLGLLPDKELKQFAVEKSGNSPCLNLLLVNLLQKAGYEANPAYISTKEHGWVNPAHPILSQFNQMIAWVRIGEQEYFLDAAGNSLPFGFLPLHDLNKKALVLDKKQVNWKDLKDPSKNYTLINYNANLKTGKHSLNCSWSGFDALEVAKHLQSEKYEDIIFSKNINIVKDSVKIDNAISTENSLKASLYFTGETDWSSDRVFFDLSLAQFFKENPFKNEKRVFPVDFGYESTKHLVFNLTVPENFSIADKPKDILLRVPDGSAAFIYQSILEKNQLQIHIKFDLKKSFIPQQDYPHLRELFSKMIHHCQQPLVFEKIK